MGALRLRQSTIDDTSAIVALCDAMMQRWYGRDGYLTADHVVTGLSTPGRDPDRDFPTVVLDDRIVVSALVHASAPYTEIMTSPLVDPGLDAGTLAAALDLVRDAARDAARAHVDAAGADPEQSLLVVTVLSENTPVVAHLRSRGFRLLRRGHEMVIDLVGAPARAEVPEGVRIAPFGADDVPEAARVLSSAFRDHHGDMAVPPATMEHWMRSSAVRLDASFLAFDEEGLVGVLMAEDGTDGGYVGALGVERRARGRGIGRALLESSFARFAETGAPLVALDVDAENVTGATRLYEAAGMRRRLTQELWAVPLVTR
jgi:mycothiol synthase